MLSDLNSKYILAHKFDKISFKLTLKIVVHNKKFQNKLDITLENYGQATGKYIEIIGDYGKEYLLENKWWNGNIYIYILGIKEFEIIEYSGYINDYNINGIKIYSGVIVKGIKEGFCSECFEGKI